MDLYLHNQVRMFLKEKYMYSSGRAPLFLVRANVTLCHRRRMELEDKAKVVASVCGQNLFYSLPRQLFCLCLCERKGRVHSNFPNRPRQNSQCGKELNKFCAPQTDTTTFALPSNSILLLCLVPGIFLCAIDEEVRDKMAEVLANQLV